MEVFHTAPDISNFKWPEGLVEDFKTFAQINPGELDSNTDVQRALMTAAGQWERATGEATIQTTFVQTMPTYQRTVYLMRQPFVSLTSVQYVDANDTTRTATSGTDFDLDPTGRAASIRWRSRPSLSGNKRPVVTITFIAGYAANAIPFDVQFAVFSVAKWHYHNREAYTPYKPAATPLNFEDLVNQHISGRGWM